MLAVHRRVDTEGDGVAEPMCSVERMRNRNVRSLIVSTADGVLLA
jgi:hypothetical protein